MNGKKKGKMGKKGEEFQKDNFFIFAEERLLRKTYMKSCFVCSQT